ncbi:hypothetical protein KAR48_14205 [bacterium]|nr:hypothetical protein [bacterium]
MEQVLNNLIALQKLDTKLRDIVSLRGDLPQQVDALNSELEAAQKAVSDLNAQLETFRIEHGECDLEVNALGAKKEKYQKQLYEVKTNREYDAVTMELEAVRLAAGEHETRILELMDLETAIEEERTQKNEILDKVKTDFDGKQQDLKKTIAKTETQEAALRKERETVVTTLQPRLVNSYERILNAKNGLAVAPVIRSACSGCFTNLPPQHVLEVRQMQRLIMCEFCGRMLVWDKEVSENEDAE